MGTKRQRRRNAVIAITAGTVLAAGLGIGTGYAATAPLTGTSAGAARPDARINPEPLPATGARTGGVPTVGEPAGEATDTPTRLTPAPTKLPETPAAYAKEAFEAWRTEQADRLRQLTDSSSYEDFTRIPRRATGRTWYAAGCDAGMGSVTCAFAAYPTGDTVTVRLPNGATGAKPHAISSAAYAAGGREKAPARDTAAFAKSAAKAFSDQNYDLLAQVTTKAGFKELTGLRPPGAQTWGAAACDAGAGQIYCTFTSKEGAKLVLHGNSDIPGSDFPRVDLHTYHAPTGGHAGAQSVS